MGATSFKACNIRIRSSSLSLIEGLYVQVLARRRNMDRLFALVALTAVLFSGTSVDGRDLPVDTIGMSSPDPCKQPNITDCESCVALTVLGLATCEWGRCKDSPGCMAVGSVFNKCGQDECVSESHLAKCDLKTCPEPSKVCPFTDCKSCIEHTVAGPATCEWGLCNDSPGCKAIGSVHEECGDDECVCESHLSECDLKSCPAGYDGLHVLEIARLSVA